MNSVPCCGRTVCVARCISCPSRTILWFWVPPKAELDGMYRRAFQNLENVPAVERDIVALVTEAGALTFEQINASLGAPLDKRDLYRVVNHLCTGRVLVLTRDGVVAEQRVYLRFVGAVATRCPTAVRGPYGAALLYSDKLLYFQWEFVLTRQSDRLVSDRQKREYSAA